MTQPRKTSTVRGRGSVSRGAGGAGGVSRGSGGGGSTGAVGAAAAAGAAAGAVSDGARRVSASNDTNINGPVSNEVRVSSGNIAAGSNNDRGGGFIACFMACSGLGVYVDRIRSAVSGITEGGRGGADAPDVMPLVGGFLLGASLLAITYKLFGPGGCTCKVEAPKQPQHVEPAPKPPQHVEPVPVQAKEGDKEGDKEVPQKKKRLRLDLCPGRT